MHILGSKAQKKKKHDFCVYFFLFTNSTARYLNGESPILLVGGDLDLHSAGVLAVGQQRVTELLQGITGVGDELADEHLEQSNAACHSVHKI